MTRRLGTLQAPMPVTPHVPTRVGEGVFVAVAIALVLVVAVRAHELVGLIAKLRPAILTCLVAAVLVFSRASFGRIRKALDDRAVNLFLFYYGWAFLTLPLALYKGLAISTLLVPAFMQFMLVLVILLCPPTREVQRKLQWAFVGGLAIHFLLYMGKGYMWRGRMYTAAGGLDPNDYAAMGSMMLPLALGIVQREKGLEKLLGLAAAAVLALGIVRTGSRGGTIAFLGAMFVFVVLSGGARRFTYLALFVLLTAVGWTISSPSFKQRMIDLAQGKEDYNSTEYSGREQIWARARGYIVANPVFGVGIGNFPIIEGKYLETIGKTGKWSEAHNAYYQAAVELGVIGGALFIGMIGMTARYGMRIRMTFRRPSDNKLELRPDYVAGAISFALSSVFLSHAYFYLFFGYLAFVVFTHRAAMAESTMRAGPQLHGTILPTVPQVATGIGPSDDIPATTRQRPRVGSGWRSAASANRVFRGLNR